MFECSHQGSASSDGRRESFEPLRAGGGPVHETMDPEIEFVIVTKGIATSIFLLLVMTGATTRSSSVLATSSDALCY